MRATEGTSGGKSIDQDSHDEKVLGDRFQVSGKRSFVLNEELGTKNTQFVSDFELRVSDFNGKAVGWVSGARNEENVKFRVSGVSEEA